MATPAASLLTGTGASETPGSFPSPLAEKRAFLESGAAWPDDPPPACIETPSSLVFLTRQRAFKLRKPMLASNDDLRFLVQRARISAEDFCLNHAFAHEIYLGLVPLVRRHDGGLALGGRGLVIDWMVEMTRLPAAQMLDRRLAVGPPPRREEIADFGARLAASYRRQPWGWGGGAAYHARLTADLQTDAGHLAGLHPHLGSFPLGDVLAWAALRLALARPEIRLRGGMGLVRQGHGDLRLRNVCLSDPPLAFHRVAIAPPGHLVDPYHEVTGLGLEAAQAGVEWIGPALLDHLAQGGFRPPSRGVLGLYAVLHCLTHARLAVAPLSDATEPDCAQDLPKLRCLLAMAVRIADSIR